MSGQALVSAANSNLLNIGTADYCMSKAGSGGDVTSIGQLITWASGLNGENLRTQADKLEKLVEEGYYSDVVADTPINELDSKWEGQGNKAFVKRWNALRDYIGRDDNSKRCAAVKAQVGAMRDLADACDDLQRTLTDACNGGKISQVRDKYVEALCSKKDSDAIDQAIAGVGLGATIGSPGGWAGIGAGGAIGGVFGLIGGVMADSEADLKRMAGAEVAVSNVGAQFEGLEKTLVLKEYGDDNKVDLNAVEHNPRDPQGDSWEGLDDEWTAS